MNEEHLIKRLSLVEADPQRIWNRMHQYYGEDFFLNIIEDEYGISPESNDQLLEKVEKQLHDLQKNSEDRILDLKREYEKEIDRLKKDLRERNMELSGVKI
jgi:predicted DNA-binding protein YlxM (UPF0122 family)